MYADSLVGGLVWGCFGGAGFSSLPVSLTVFGADGFFPSCCLMIFSSDELSLDWGFLVGAGFPSPAG